MYLYKSLTQTQFLVKRNKAVIYFLLRFFVSYFLLTGVYQLYIQRSQQKSPEYQCCGITNLVSKQVESVGNFLGFNIVTKQNPDELSQQIFLDDQVVAQIVEGCNAVSVIILYIAFIIAFKGSFRNTILFVIIGSFLIYALNILRIVLISWGLYKYPQYGDLLHQILFPAIIYGFTLLLWIIWVKYFAVNSNSTKRFQDE